MKKALLLSFLAFFSSFFLCAQKSRIDSLTQALKKAKEDTNKVKTLYFLASELEDIKPTKAIEYANQGLSLSKKISFQKGISVCLNSLGYANSGLGEYAKALNYYKQQYIIVSELNDSMRLASVYDNMGIVFFSWGNNDTALELRKKANLIYSSLNQESYLANGLIWIGNIIRSREFIRLH